MYIHVCILMCVWHVRIACMLKVTMRIYERELELTELLQRLRGPQRRALGAVVQR